MTETKPIHYIIIIAFGIMVLTFMRISSKQEPTIENYADSSAAEFILPQESHLKNLRQLTISGENAEAYFSPDGKKLIFQFHDGDSLCDQIYILDLATGEKELVSTGRGVTTCAYFQFPNDDKIVYASTHLTQAECPPPPDFSQGYVWKLYEDYDIFSADIKGGNLERLTDAPLYDAEATYAEDGSRIIYTSLSSGDLEVWIMNPDGSDKRQLTSRLGYDGGPFFSHNGKKIVWRAFYPETETEILEYKNLLAENTIRPMNLQIRIMERDGSNKIQVTNNQAANFAPFFFPDDKRIIFCSNMADPNGRDFDLWAIDIDGSNLERITYFDGFDGFPVFSPDGKYLVFCSNRNQAKPGDTNVFICEWIH